MRIGAPDAPVLPKPFPPDNSGRTYLLRHAVSQIQIAVSVHSPTTNFAFGRSQKIINIILKYCYAWRLCKRSDSPAIGDVSWVDKWKTFMHVPVDSYTINHVTKDLAYYVGFPCGTWALHMTEYEYMGIQDAVRKHAYLANLDPICYEMREIWVTDDDGVNDE